MKKPPLIDIRDDTMKSYSTGDQNIITDEFQMIRLSEGWCPHNCPWCREPKEALKEKEYPIPEIVRRDVRISDMNILASPHGPDKIRQFKDIRLDGKVVYPWLECGIDYRFLTQEIAQALKDSRFRKIHIAWDWLYRDQKRVKIAVQMLRRAGYEQVGIFMICNHPAVSYRECCNKLNLCKYWNCQVKDCWYDNQLSPNIIPIAWSVDQISSFRKEVRKHNQIVNFQIDPEL